MKKSYWGDALLTANYIRNRCPRHYNNGMCPYERFHGKKPQYNYMKIFGCRGWVLQRRKHIKHLQRWERNAKEYVFIGYTNNGYKMMSIDESEVIYSRNIIFNEALLGFPHNWNVMESENIVESIIIESDDEESKGEESNSEEEREQSFYYDIDDENAKKLSVCKIPKCDFNFNLIDLLVAIFYLNKNDKFRYETFSKYKFRYIKNCRLFFKA